MKFGPLPVTDAAGAILAHSVRHSGGVIRKGTILGTKEVATLRDSGIAEVVAARLEAGDVHEDAAAGRLAHSVAGAGVRVDAPFTGRSNLYADASGLLVVDRDRIDRLNRVDPAITVATLPEFAPVESGRMIATVKIIPFSVPEPKLAEAIALGEAIHVAPFQAMKVGLVATVLPSLNASVLDKTRRLLDERLTRAGARVTEEKRVAHNLHAVASALRELDQAGADLLIVFGASAVVDAADVVPAGIVAAGGEIRHLGMPVDPGNLLVLGAIGTKPVVGAPGCARSPKENGFDWVLFRLLAGLDVTSADITGLGVGGLLMEIVSRPQPREGGDPLDEGSAAKKVAAIVLAAGQSQRMGGPQKLLATIAGKPLARIAAEAAAASRANPVIVVTGHLADKVEPALQGLPVEIVRNPDFADGLSTSLRAGLARVPEDADGVLVLLADMPEIDAMMIDRVIDAFDPDAGALIVVSTVAGKRGNPVLWSSRYFADLAAIHGDTGGRHLIGANPDAVVEVELGEAAGRDIDTPAELAAAGGTVDRG